MYIIPSWIETGAEIFFYSSVGIGSDAVLERVSCRGTEMKLTECTLSDTSEYCSQAVGIRCCEFSVA